MICISVLQPHATLLAIGEKKIETRSWAWSFRGRVGLHASKQFQLADRLLVDQEPFKSALANHGYHRWEDLPCGALIGSACLMRSAPVQRESYQLQMSIGAIEFPPVVGTNEYAFGNYEVGRYGWVMHDAKLYKRPVLAVGCQGPFHLNDEKIRLALAGNWSIPIRGDKKKP